MADKKQLTKEDFDYQGLWLTESKSGTKHLSGFNKEKGIGFKVFTGAEDGSYRLVLSKEDELITLGEMKVITFEDGNELKKLGDFAEIRENQFYQEQKDQGKNAPEYTLKLRKGVLNGF